MRVVRKLVDPEEARRLERQMFDEIENRRHRWNRPLKSPAILRISSEKIRHGPGGARAGGTHNSENRLQKTRNARVTCAQSWCSERPQ